MSFIYATLCVNILICGFVLWRVTRVSGLLMDLTVLGRMLRFSVPLLPHSLAHVIRHWGDRLILSAFVSPAATGLFQIATSYGSVLMMGIDAFRNTNNPRFFQMISQPENVHKLVAVLSVSLGLFSAAATLLALFSKEIIAICTGAAFHESYLYAPFVLSAFLLFLIYFNVVNVLFEHARTRVVSAITVTITCLSLVAGIFLISAFGLTGAGISLLLSNLLLALTVYRFSQKSLRLPWPIVRAVVFASLPLLVVLVEASPINTITAKLLLAAALLPVVYRFIRNDLSILGGRA